MACIGNSWDSLCQASVARISVHTMKVIKWIKPPHWQVKKNSDGGCVQGQCGGGGIIGDSQSKMIFVYAIKIGPDTSNLVEAATLLYGLKWYV